MTAKKRAVKKTAAKTTTRKVTAGGVVWHKVSRAYRVTHEYVEVKLISAWKHLPRLTAKETDEQKEDVTADWKRKRNAATRGREKLEKASGLGSVTGFALFPVPFLTHYFAPGILPEVSVVVFIAIAISCLFPVRKSTEFRSVMTVSLAPLILASAMAVVAMYPATSGEVRSEDRAPRDTGSETVPNEPPTAVDSPAASSFAEEPVEAPEEPVTDDRDSTPVLDISLRDLLVTQSQSSTSMTLEYDLKDGPKKWKFLPSLEPGDKIEFKLLNHAWVSFDPDPMRGEARFVEAERSVVARNTGRFELKPAIYPADGSEVKVQFTITR